VSFQAFTFPVDGSTPIAIVGSPIRSPGLSIAGFTVAQSSIRDFVTDNRTAIALQVGWNGRANVELAPANKTKTWLLTHNLSLRSRSLQATGIECPQISNTQRSFIQHVSLLFNDAGGFGQL